MKIKLEAPQLEESKKRFADSRWFPVVVVVATAVVLRACSKQTIIINVNEIEK